jgi:hypothetical protein
MIPSKFTTILASCAMAGLIAFSGSVSAATFTAVDGSATAVFTLGNGTVDITLTNNLTTTANITDLLSDLSFSISGGTTTLATTSVAPGGSRLRCVDGTAGCVGTGDAANAWFYGLNGQVGSSGDIGGGTYLLTALVGNPKSLIIGDHSFSCQAKCPDGLGNQQFQPYLDGSATFSLLIAGVTADSTISNVVFSFGTAPERLVGVPIPAAVWLFASGLLGLIGIARRRLGVSSNALAAA